MHKLKRTVFGILLLALIIKANECYGMEINENKGGEKTVMEKIKALPYPKIFICGNKLFFSLAHSIINNFYELEKLEMNKVYSLKKYLCVGYRLQPSFMTPYSFLDFNVNILGVVLDTFIPVVLNTFIPSCLGGLSLTSLSFYFITSLFNINLWVRIAKDFYISINIVGLMRAIFMPLLIKNSNEADENDNNLDNNLSDNNNPDVKNKSFNQENNNNNPDFNNKNFNQENNNEDEWEKIKKEKGISEEQDKRIQEMYQMLEDEYGVSGFFEEEKVKKIIFDNNFNYEKIVKWIEDNFENNN